MLEVIIEMELSLGSWLSKNINLIEFNLFFVAEFASTVRHKLVS